MLGRLTWIKRAAQALLHDARLTSKPTWTARELAWTILRWRVVRHRESLLPRHFLARLARFVLPPPAAERLEQGGGVGVAIGQGLRLLEQGPVILPGRI